MAISKKLVLIIMCTLGMQFATQGYDAVGLKTEVAQILDFIRECYKHNMPEAKKVAEWLEKGIANEYANDRVVSVLYNPDSIALYNSDIIAIARALTAHTTMDAKLIIVSQIMAEKAIHKAEQQKKWREENAKYAQSNAQNREKEHKSYIKELTQWGQENLYRGMVWGGLAMLGAVVIYNKFDTAFMMRITEMIAEKVGDEWEKRENKKSVKKA